jgi:hypothetical protein
MSKALDKKVAELLARAGVAKEDFDSLPDDEEKKDPPERVRFRGEAVLYALEYPLSPRVTRICKGCKEPFLTVYKGWAYCSNECAVVHLKKHFGLAWRPNSEARKEVWERHGSAGTIQLKALQAMKAIVAQAEADLGYSIVLPEIRPFVPKSTYWASQDTRFESEEDQKISVSPVPLEVQLESLSSLVSPEQPVPPSSDNSEKKVQSQEPEKSSEPSDPLAELFSL